jgi:hypothetical protein
LIWYMRWLIRVSGPSLKASIKENTDITDIMGTMEEWRRKHDHRNFHTSGSEKKQSGS